MFWFFHSESYRLGSLTDHRPMLYSVFIQQCPDFLVRHGGKWKHSFCCSFLIDWLWTMILIRELRHLKRDIQVVFPYLFKRLKFANTLVSRLMLIDTNSSGYSRGHSQCQGTKICFIIKAPWPLILWRSRVIFFKPQLILLALREGALPLAAKWELHRSCTIIGT